MFSDFVKLLFQGQNAITAVHRILAFPKWFIFPCVWQSRNNKLAKARKMRKPPGTLSLKKFGLGNLWVEKV